MTAKVKVMRRVYDLRTLFELRASSPITPPDSVGRLFIASDRLGLVDATGAIWPVEFAAGITAPKSGDVIKFTPENCLHKKETRTKYDRDDSFITIARIDETTLCAGAWPTHRIPSPLEAAELFTGLPPNRTHFRPSASASRRRCMRARDDGIARTRRFFSNRGFTHMETPALVPSGGVETYLHTFNTTYHDHRGKEWPVSLPTSPEFALKKLLAEGFPRVFQIARCYRNQGELAQWHEPEFLMLEWYRAGGLLTDIMDDTRRLVLTLAESLGSPFEVPAEWPLFTVSELFLRQTGIDLAQVQDPDVFRKEASQHCVGINTNDNWDSIFFKVFFEKIEPFILSQRACFVSLFPRQMGALARVASEPIFVERFEAYLNGVEICNGYQELTDSDDLLKRFGRIQKLRKEEVRRDPIFEQTMRFGLPPCAGNALGLDRLLAFLSGNADIHQHLPIPFLAQFPRNSVASE